jgi:hypothetical protein
MNINYIVLGLLSLIVGFYSWKAYFNWNQDVTPNFLPWVPIDVRKTKVYVSQTRDAGMFTEKSRRLAVLLNQNGGYSYKGSTNGYLEYALTALCYCPPVPVPICPPAPDVIWDGGNATSEVCDIVDGGNALTEADAVDFGNAQTNVCDV